MLTIPYTDFKVDIDTAFDETWRLRQQFRAKHANLHRLHLSKREAALQERIDEEGASEVFAILKLALWEETI